MSSLEDKFGQSYLSNDLIGSEFKALGLTIYTSDISVIS